MNIESLTFTAKNASAAMTGIENLAKNARPQEAEGGQADFSQVLKRAGSRFNTGGAPIDKKSKLYEQCAELETFFLKNLISGMRKTIDKSSLTKGGFAGEIYEDMLYDEYTKTFSRSSGFGFADLAYLELTGARGKVINTHL